MDDNKFPPPSCPRPNRRAPPAALCEGRSLPETPPLLLSSQASLGHPSQPADEPPPQGGLTNGVVEHKWCYKTGAGSSSTLIL